MTKRSPIAKTASALRKLREICLALPDTKETMTWGEPHFRVGNKIFAGYGVENGKPVIWFKLKRANADAVINDPRFRRAPYGGQHGWVSMDATTVRDWDEVRSMVLESYGLIAPKRTLAKLDEATAATQHSAKKTAGKRATRKGTKPPRPRTRAEKKSTERKSRNKSP
jgi:predicted DNA-binding protein (MmcQ/YjbR family)